VFLPRERTAIDRLERTRRGAVERCHNFREVAFDDRPVICGERRYCQTPPRKVLFVNKGLIASHENVKVVFFGLRQPI
jgi:hypothetical protein